MRNITLFAITYLLFVSCDNYSDPVIETPELLGTWRLIEVLADPGNGSGTFNPVDSDITLTVKSICEWH